MIILSFGIKGISQTPQSKTYIKSKFETGDDYGMFIDNSYNVLGNDILKSSGTSVLPYYAPYTTKSPGVLYTGSTVPTSTATTLNYDGIFRATKLYIGDSLIYASGLGGGYFALSSGNIYPTTLSNSFSINTNSASGYNFRVNGRALFDLSIKTDTLYIPYSTTHTSTFYTDASGNLTFDDDVTGTKTLADLAAGGSSTLWKRNATNQISLYNSYDSVCIGRTITPYAELTLAGNIWMNSAYSNISKITMGGYS